MSQASQGILIDPPLSRRRPDGSRGFVDYNTHFQPSIQRATTVHRTSATGGRRDENPRDQFRYFHGRKHHDPRSWFFYDDEDDAYFIGMYYGSRYTFNIKTPQVEHLKPAFREMTVERRRRIAQAGNPARAASYAPIPTPSAKGKAGPGSRGGLSTFHRSSFSSPSRPGLDSSGQSRRSPLETLEAD